MPWRLATVLLAVCLPAIPLQGAEAPPQSARASAVLEAAARAYRSAPALRDTLSYVVKSPGAEQEPKALEYALGAGAEASVKDPTLQAVAVRGTMYLTRSNAPEQYVEVPYGGDFAASLNRIVGEQGSLFELPPIAMRAGKKLPAWIDDLRFKLLAPLRITGCERIQENGRPLDEIRFAADNGRLTLRVDARTHFFASLSVEMQPPGAPEGFFVHVEGTFAPEVLPSAAGLIHFEPGQRKAVAGLGDLGTDRLRLGAPAPDLTAVTLDGRKVALRDLRGSVVVLDFWATWCAPCWKTLHETQALFDWAAKTHRAVAVFGVDTLEEFPTPEEKKRQAASFWQSQHFTMPTLLDLDGAVFRGFGNPGLPSLVVIAPDGTVAKLHEGLFPDMQQTLQKEVEAALAP